MRNFKFPLLHIILWSSIASLVMISCEGTLVTEIDIEDDLGYEQQLGLSGIIYHQFDGEPDPQVSAILLAESQSFVASPEERIYYEGAELNLFRGSEFVGEFMDIGDGRYTNVDANTLLSYDMPADSYTIEVTHPTLGEVSASTTMPEPVYISDIKIDSVATVPGLGSLDFPTFLVTITFTDPPGPNFYGIHLTARYPNPDIDSIVPVFLDVNDPSLIQHSNYSSFIFSDATFDDSEHSISFTIYTDYRDRAIWTAHTVKRVEDQLRVRWSCLSEDYFKFVNSEMRSQQSDNFGPFSEPVSLYNNVENGLGYFGAANYYLAKVE